MSDDREKTPDLLDTVLGGRGGGTPSERQDDKAVSRQDVKQLGRRDVKTSKAKPYKLTVYVDEAVNEDLELMQVKLKRTFGVVTKSKLVEGALRICLKDIAASGLEALIREDHDK
ncbi:hypothetical protein [Maridesulfovibrio ferrireducens]|uniref:hypothetical protein n=1 Tax=Maridesulfovibrio ferrireducens TaxID=246191 RepID=UPI001A2F5225|nr:hypothetical protein [Maridesulfovibrio ferrireducens]MBI9111297.1 hypothetical protein [Maridesulfovibrio ferrireducens]